MSLPKLAVPVYVVTIPSSGKKIQMKSLTAKEYKLLLIAKEDSSEEQQYITVKQLVNNCVVDAGFDVEDLKIYDLEYIFLQLMRSSNANKNNVLSYKCMNKTNGVECANTIKTSPALQNAEVVYTTDKKELVIECKTTDDSSIALKFAYPTIRYMNHDMDLLRAIAMNLESVSTEDMVYKIGKDYTVEEAAAFIENLNESQCQQIIEFIETLPRVELDHKFTCDACGFEHNIKLKGLSDFFM